MSLLQSRFLFTNVNKTIYRFGNNMSITAGATCGAGSTYPSGAPEITPVVGGARVAVVPLFVTLIPIVSVCFVHTSLSI